MYDVIIDVETFGNSKNAIIASIGAVVFKLESGQIYDTININIDVKSAYELGLEFDPDTVLWWLKQDETPRLNLLDKNRYKITDALGKLSMFLNTYKDIIVWGKGPEFDVSLLENAYQKAQLPLPWIYYNTDSVRSYFRLNKRLNLGIEEKKATVKHDALADALAETETVINIFQQLKKRMGL